MRIPPLVHNELGREPRAQNLNAQADTEFLAHDMQMNVRQYGDVVAASLQFPSTTSKANCYIDRNKRAIFKPSTNQLPQSA
jgi:hypothetical protein